MFFSCGEIELFWKSVDMVHAPRPVLVKRPFSNMIATEDSVLCMLKSWSDAAKQGRAGMIDIDKLELRALPDKDDRTLDECVRRIETHWHRDWYAYINDVQQYGGELWERAVEILLPAIRANGGLPAGGFKMELFFGKYGVTPTGVHLDTSDNLAFIVRGPKRMVFWPGDRFPSLLRIPDGNAPTQELALKRRCEDSMTDAIVIDAEAGDVIYWPKEYWHLGASAECWTAMITIPMWWNARPATVARFVLDRAFTLDGEPQLHPFNPDAVVNSALSLPDTLSRPIHEAVSQIAGIDSVARLVWASIASSYGFTVPPAKVAGSAICDSTRVRVKYPIVVLPKGSSYVVFACGHSTQTSIAAADTAFGRLNSTIGTDYGVGELRDILMGNNNNGDTLSSERECVRLVSELVSFRALEVVIN